MSGQVILERYRPSPIPKGGLQIILKAKFIISDEKREFFGCLEEVINKNYCFPEEENMLGAPVAMQEESNEENWMKNGS